MTVCLLSLSAQGADNEQRLKVPVESTVVYLDGAEITHNKTVTLEAGRNSVVFTGISSHLISKSVQINAGNDASILSISDKINYLNSSIETPKLKSLKDSIKLLRETVEQLNYEKEAYVTEKKMLMDNQEMGGREKAIAVAELKSAADFYRSRIKEINVELFKLDKKLNPCYNIIARLDQEINECNGKLAAPTAEVTVLLAAATKLITKIELKYLVSDAGWAPSYDLIAEDVNKPIELKYRAKVFNNTDVDWNNVKLKLSTSDPSLNASKPQLAAWYLNFQNEYDNNYYGNANQQVQIQAQANYNARYDAEEDAKAKTSGDAAVRGARGGMTNVFVDGKPITSPITFEDVQVSELSAEFEIKNTYTIPADAKPYIVEVTNYNLPAVFKYYSIPKIEKEAFLLARISGWEQLDLVEGPANVYFGGSYVGQSYIYTRSLDDTLDLSFGRDKKVMVSRTKLKDFNSKSFSGTNKKETQSYEIVVKNNRKMPILIDVEDQLPVSQNSEIVVEVTELSKAKKDDATGKLLWNYTIAPGEQQKITLTYSIKYPKSKAVNTRKYANKKRAKF